MTAKTTLNRDEWLDLLAQSLQRSYERFSGEGKPRDVLGEKWIEVFRRMRANASFESVWAAIERRVPPDAKTLDQQYHEDFLREEERLKELTDRGADLSLHDSEDWWIERHSEPETKRPSHFVDLAHGLVDTVAKALLHDFEPETTSMRRKRAQRIKRAVAVLRQEMRFHEMGDTFQPFLMEHIRDRVTELALDDLRMFEAVTDVKVTERDRAIALEAVRKVSTFPEDTLRTFSKAADAWAEAPLEIPRPNDPNAARTLLLRRVTGFFVGHLGTPLQAQTAIIGMEFFPDAGDLDASTVAKLCQWTKPTSSAPG